jgi:hypothetical protein
VDGVGGAHGQGDMGAVGRIETAAVHQQTVGGL